HQQREDEHDAEAESDSAPNGPTALRRKRQCVRAGHDELAVGEVDEPQDAEDKADPHRHQRVDRAEPDRVGERLPIDAEDGQGAHVRYAPINASVSAACSGPSVSRTLPFASTYDRSANATVRCARLSTSRTAT